MNNPDAEKRDNLLSDAEWEAMSDIRTWVGCLTPTLNGQPSHNIEAVKRLLTKAQADGLDPERIYRAAIAPDSPITRRIPPWEDVNPGRIRMGNE